MTILISGGTVVSATGARPADVLIVGERIAALTEPGLTAAPGEAGSPLASNSTLVPFSSSRGTRKSYNWLGSTRKMASSFVISLSSTICRATRTAARPVRLPLRVCSM